MDPHADNVSGLSLPTQPAQTVEPLATVPVPPPFAPSSSTPAQQTQQLAVTDQAIVDAPTEEASGDGLDQEWIDKAKAIVEKTKNDPYIESAELGKVKANYLKIRYNKHIKVAEDPS